MCVLVKVSDSAGRDPILPFSFSSLTFIEDMVTRALANILDCEVILMMEARHGEWWKRKLETWVHEGP